jgi:hypothetical protein
MSQAQKTKPATQLMVNANAARVEIIPAGISRLAVRGFRLSYFESITRLNDMAALRASTIQTITSRNFSQLNG